jgi:hypothetical protein
MSNKLINEILFWSSIAHQLSPIKILTSQITGGKKKSEERAAIFAVRVHLPC